MKQHCSAVIAGLVAFTLLSFIAIGASSPSKLVLEYYTWGSDIQTIENEEYLFSHFIEMHPHIDIQVSATGGIPAHNEKIAVQHAAGVAPDIFTIAATSGHTPLFFDTGMVLDLTGMAKRDKVDFDRYIPGAFAYTWKEGALLGVPRSTKGTAYATGVLVYNRKLFEEAGITYPWSGWTFDDFIGVAKKLTRSTTGAAQPDVWGTQAGSGWIRPLQSNGGELVNAEGTQVLVDTPQAIEALEWYAKWQNEFNVAGGSFNRQTAAMHFVSTGGFLRTSPPGLDWAFGEAPRGPRSDKSFTAGGCNIVSISSQTKHPEEAWALLKFLISEENQKREVFELGAGTALLRSIAFDRRHIFREGPPYDLTPILLQATKPEPQFMGWPEAKTALTNALAPVWRGEKSVRTALEEVIPRVNALLRSGR